MIPSWLTPYLTKGIPQSSKRLVLVASAVVLLLVTLIIGGACAYWIATHGDLGTGAAGALTLVAGIAAALAGVAHRKPETPAGWNQP